MLIFPTFTISEHELMSTFVRSSGAGGQNVNKVSTKAVLKWNVLNSKDIPLSVKNRFLKRWSSRISTKGELVLTSDKSRSRLKNFETVLERLQEMIQAVIDPPKKRIKKKPSKSSIERRLKEKKVRSDLKKTRIKPKNDY